MVRSRVLEWFFRFTATGLVPRRWFAPALPDILPRVATDAPVALELVSHCWRYHRLLAFQLSSLVLHPPRLPHVTMTVFYSPEDSATRELLEHFGTLSVPNVRWNWWPLEKTRLFRRAIGRNMAARATDADWIWFTDCDVTFHEDALDGAASALRGSDDLLLFPRRHQVSDILEPDDPLLEGAGGRRLVEIDPQEFHPETRDRAVGGFQIVRGDVARAAGYCGHIAHYQRPVDRWVKTYEDRTFRWLLGTPGTPVEIPGLFRIRHAAKGRDRSGRAGNGLARRLSRGRLLLRRLRQGPTGRQR